jgi:hypothetical protein
MWVRIVEKARTRLSAHLLNTVVGNKGMYYQSCQSEYESSPMGTFLSETVLAHDGRPILSYRTTGPQTAKPCSISLRTSNTLFSRGDHAVGLVCSCPTERSQVYHAPSCPKLDIYICNH